MLGSTDGVRLRTEEVRRFANPIPEVGGHCYRDLLCLYREILEGLRRIAGRNLVLTSVGIDSRDVDFAVFKKHTGYTPAAYRSCGRTAPSHP